MASHKFSIDFEDFEKELDELRKIDGNIYEATEKALIKSHEYITPLIEKKLDRSNLPAHGKYSSKDRRNSLKQLIREPNLEWENLACTVDVGFSLKKSAVPIFLILGTTHTSPVNGLKDVLEGDKTREEVAKIQHNVLVEEIEKTNGR